MILPAACSNSPYFIPSLSFDTIALLPEKPTICYNNMLLKFGIWAGEMAHGLRADGSVVVVPENQGLILSISMGGHNQNLQFSEIRCPLLAAVGTRHAFGIRYTDVNEGKTSI